MTQFETARLIIRPYTLDDLDDHFAVIASDPDVMQFLPGGEPRTYEQSQRSVAYMAEQWDTQDYGFWALFLKDGGDFIGYTGLMTIPPDHQYVEIAYAIGKDYWGQGYTTEAGRATLTYGFDVCGFEQILALAVPDNIASQRVMEKIGMIYDGLTTAFYDGWELVQYHSDR